jgi:urease gamma subunit
MKLIYSDGTIFQAADLEDALAGVRLNYPEAVAFQGRRQVEVTSDVRMGVRILIWGDTAVCGHGAVVAAVEDV